MNRTPRPLALLAGALCALSQVVTLSAAEPEWERMPERPEWSVDITDNLVRLPDGTASAEVAATAQGEPFGVVLSRERRLADTRAPGHEVWWRATVSLPADDKGEWPLSLQVDESRVILKAWFDGAPINWISDESKRYQDGQRSVVLPLDKDRRTGTLVLKVTHLPHLYASAFGRLTLRPARLSEIIRIDAPKGDACRVSNHSTKRLSTTVNIRHEDYFGVQLAARAEELTLGAGAESLVSLNTPKHHALYKTRIWAERDGKTTWDYWTYADGERENWQRPQVLRVAKGWEFVFSPQAITATSTPPKDGWTPAELPHQPKRKEYTSHWMWYRCRVTVPRQWLGQRVQLYLPRVQYHARVFFDGKPVAERANWQLPDAILLPDSAGDGKEHELLLGITDYTAALRPDLPLPAGGTVEAPARGLLAGIPHMNADSVMIGLHTVPELLAVPPQRVEWAAITPVSREGKSALRAKVELRNDSDLAGAVLVRATVLDRGKEVLQVPQLSVDLPVNGSASVDLNAPWADPIFWSPERPQLYELRIELIDAANPENVLDVRRERFGFRVFGHRDGYFTLNGERFNLLGGSHVVLQDLRWPVLPHPFRFVRHYFHSAPSGFMAGRQVCHMADEMGLPLKAEHIEHNAHHQERYAYHLPQMWENLYREIAAVYRTQVNHPSIVMWDVGNEVFYPGKGEAALMGALFRRLRALDPTRLVTVGGSEPFPTGAEVLDMHGWGDWSHRMEYFFFHPEQRPSYLKKRGVFHRPAAGEPREDWKAVVERPIAPRWPVSSRAEPPAGLLHLDGRPILFSEGHYYEDSVPEELVGHAALVPLPGGDSNFEHELNLHRLNMVAQRRLSIQNVRQARLAGSMIHVDRGFSRALSPLAAFSFDRRFRVHAGEPLRTRWSLHQDLCGRQRVRATWRLWDGSRMLSEKIDVRELSGGEVALVDLELAVPDASEKEYRLTVEVRAEGRSGVFRDEETITVFARDPLTPPAGQTLSVFDPSGTVTALLKENGVTFAEVKTVDDWKGGAADTLLCAPDSLSQIPAEKLPILQQRVAAGGRMIVLNHQSLPRFLNFPLTQNTGAMLACSRVDPFSPLTAGLLQTDLRFWQTRENDQLVFWNPLESPTTGNARVHVAGKGAALLEVAEGSGRVVFCQLNLKDALGLDPAARRVLANLLRWTGAPSPFARNAALIVATDAAFLRALRGRLGLEGTVTAQPSAEQLAGARLTVLDGRDAALRTALTAHRKALLDALNAGSTLFIQHLDNPGAKWLTDLVGSEITVEPFAHNRALLTGAHPLTAGLMQSALYWKNLRNTRLDQSQEPVPQQVGHLRIGGAQFRPFLNPAYLGEIPVGKGRVVVSQLRSLEYGAATATRVLSTVLSNAGAALNPRGIDEGAGATAWTFNPIPLDAHVNLSLSDDVDGQRGWHNGGAKNDMRMFPTGKQTLRGVDYRITDPAQHGGKAIIGLGVTKGTDTLPKNVKGIAVNARADRLYFMHATAWGVPEFVYRVYYLEDRKAWIPGKPDPFVDVVVKPNEHIQDWWFAGDVDATRIFLPGATVPWTGENPTSKAGGRKVGCYQMTWDNPHPEKVIESIDILAENAKGEGQIFVLGITAATRAESSMPSLEKLLPGIKREQVHTHLNRGRYGLVLLKDGTVPLIHGPDGQPIAFFKGWYLQGSLNPPGKPVEFKHLGMQKDTRTDIKSETDAAGGKIFRTEIRDDGPIRWQQTITCQPASIRVDYSFEIVKPLPLDQNPALTARVEALGKGQGTASAPNEFPILLPGAAGVLSIQCSESCRKWHASPGYWIEGQSTTFTLLNEKTRAVGSKFSFWFEVQIP